MHQTPLWNLLLQIKERRFIDLTHAFDETTPHAPMFPELIRQPLFTHEKNGFRAEQIQLVGQWGTHVDAPYHFHSDLRKLHEITVEEMILSLVVIDISDKAADNNDYVITQQDIEQWEQLYGTIPENSFIALRSDWSLRWPNATAMQNKDEQGIAHYPGWSLSALKFLCEKRNIVAIGHETTDTDSGLNCSNANYECEAYILQQNKYQIEILANLHLLPSAGAIVICAFPKLKNGTGFPARIFAIV